MPERPRVLVVALGGTIASTVDDSGRAHPRLQGADLVDSVPALAEIAQIEVDSIAPRPSCEITFDVLRDVAERITRAHAAGITSVVVTQGTDTIEESAFTLDLLVPPDVAVVVTGAMRHSDLPGADGPANLVDAVRTAVVPSARSHGVLVALNGQIHSARSVRKAHTSSTSAFVSGELGSAGVVHEDRVILSDPLYCRPRLELGERSHGRPRVLLVKLAMSDDGWWLDAAETADALIVEGFGGGHIPTAQAERVVALASRIPVVLASRTGGGNTLRSTYGGFAGSETALLAAGLIPAGSLDGLKARIAVTVALWSGASHRRIGQLLELLDTPASQYGPPLDDDDP